jgi:hypothetical protein
VRSAEEPAALVAAAPRTGTGHLAAVLRACGLTAGHEAWWGLEPRCEPDLDVDVSWLGTFDVGFRGRRFAQTRDPRDAVPSIAANEGVHPWRVVLAQHAVLTGDPVEDALRVWVAWTARAVGLAERWWRVEDLSADVLAGVFGVPCGRAEAALASIPPGVNHRAETRRLARWPASSAGRLAAGLALELGYPDPRVEP